MADISKIKIPAGNTYNMKDATARSNITKITNKTTKLAYGDELAVDGNDLKLLDPNNNVLSTVTLPGGGINPPDPDYFNFRSNWYLSCIDDPTSVKWNAGGIPSFTYFSALDNYASDWNNGYFQTTSALAAGAETEYLLALPTPNDMVNYTWSSPYAMSDYQTNPTYLRLNGFIIGMYANPTLTQKTLVNNIYDSTNNPLYNYIGSILSAEETQIWDTMLVNYNDSNTRVIEQSKIIYLTDYSTKVYRIQHVKLKNVGSNTLASGTTIGISGRPVKLMPTCAVYSEYTPT